MQPDINNCGHAVKCIHRQFWLHICSCLVVPCMTFCLSAYNVLLSFFDVFAHFWSISYPIAIIVLFYPKLCSTTFY